MARWHLTLILALLAAVGIALASGVALQRWQIAAPPQQVEIQRVEPAVEPIPAPALPMATRPDREPTTFIPELTDPPPAPAPIEIAPPPVPDALFDDCPMCGMG